MMRNLCFITLLHEIKDKIIFNGMTLMKVLINDLSKTVIENASKYVC